jgi:hypothetical protein
LNARAEVVGLTAQEGAALYCQPTARLTENRMFDWLETQLRSRL